MLEKSFLDKFPQEEPNILKWGQQIWKMQSYTSVPAPPSHQYF